MDAQREALLGMIPVYEETLAQAEGSPDELIGTCYHLGMAYKDSGQVEKTLPVLLKSFTYDSPRPEVAAEIGYLYKKWGKPDQAASWFKVALEASRQPPLGEAGFKIPVYWGYLPNLELGIHAFHQGDYQKAYHYNEAAAVLRPDCLVTINNRACILEKLGPEGPAEIEEPIHEFLPMREEVLGASGDDVLDEAEAMSPSQLNAAGLKLKWQGRLEEAIGYWERFREQGGGSMEENVSVCYHLAMAYKDTGAPEHTLGLLRESFIYDSPRPEAAAEMGYFYQNRGQSDLAASWFKTSSEAARQRSHFGPLGFRIEVYWDYLPNLELAAYYLNRGEEGLARRYHARASQVRPDCERVRRQQELLDGLVEARAGS